MQNYTQDILLSEKSKLQNSSICSVTYICMKKINTYVLVCAQVTLVRTPNKLLRKFSSGTENWAGEERAPLFFISTIYAQFYEFFK